VDYSQVDSRLAPEGKSVGAVCAVDYPSDWENLSREEYNRMKADVADTITDRCEQFIPGFRDAIEYVEVATSLSVKRFTLNPGGAVYGFAQNPDKSIEYLSALPDNIHIASAWGKLGGGFSGAFINGYNCATQLLSKA
jgi:phytoene dehydrogenase-like protein